MDLKQFDDWYADLCVCFPDIAAYINQSPDPQAALAKWFVVLEDYQLEHALEANKKMLKGIVKPPAAFERHKLPSIIADVCKGMVAMESETTTEKLFLGSGQVERILNSTRPAGWPSMADAVKQLVAATKRGEDPHELAMKIMPVPDDKLPRYKCLGCRDKGMVFVWDISSMRLAAKKQLKPPDNVSGGNGCYRIVMACGLCPAGEKYPELMYGGWDYHAKQYRRTTAVTYEPGKFCKCDGFTQAEIDKLVEFMEGYDERNLPKQQVSAWDATTL